MYNVSSGLRSVEILQTLVFELIIHVLFKLKPWQPHGEHNASRSRRDVPAEQDCIILHKLQGYKVCCSREGLAKGAEEAASAARQSLHQMAPATNRAKLPESSFHCAAESATVAELRTARL